MKSISIITALVLAVGSPIAFVAELGGGGFPIPSSVLFGGFVSVTIVLMFAHDYSARPRHPSMIRLPAEGASKAVHPLAA